MTPVWKDVWIMYAPRRGPHGHNYNEAAEFLVMDKKLPLARFVTNDLAHQYRSWYMARAEARWRVARTVRK